MSQSLRTLLFDAWHMPSELRARANVQTAPSTGGLSDRHEKEERKIDEVKQRGAGGVYCIRIMCGVKSSTIQICNISQVRGHTTPARI